MYILTQFLFAPSLPRGPDTSVTAANFLQLTRIKTATAQTPIENLEVQENLFRTACNSAILDVERNLMLMPVTYLDNARRNWFLVVFRSLNSP